ncbi:Phenylalanine--tRNA ligase alpha subunit [Candidatus Rhabdochlamydia oedothoracis]|uniref:Phenylalanine--tRNA ligase alpha subunit n=1 Tax=Candidatus Rhabdochlamydia oedothoracis TaxID=2720720 RepID=A0ABX8V1E9_9BACT|nr:MULTISPECIES: phenylalanine--tRNA ligase subunit alpha [Rhabdochlamydia]KAG6559844.1 Phenylalanine--tRNA ligase alpha subunit [Candidatus Rhabdochlamydia sp. W815]MCL6755648.1 phenylalanine--tRNA ligase subunit alpha [Candidatus Rhabdochlamydia oedothoracis]QYF48691.1 Phenylalanine--tRNA ligase alpha subunit [Candidatus Rhabdochlamydia oedothoracis]
MRDTISSIQKQFQSDLSQIKNSKDVELLKVKYLGKKGLIQHIMQQLKEVSKDLRPQIGKEINDLKEEILQLCQNGLESFLNVEQTKRLSEEKIDVTIPGRRRFIGRRHPLQLTLNKVIDLFCNMGFSVQYGPDIDSDYYNYEGLNFPPDHPARDTQDTFYITKDLLLRSHTSNTQLRVMQEKTPPIRIIAPGTVYRNETISSRSHVFFHQIEGLYIDRKVTFADLLATMDEFWKKLFGPSVQTRFRPSYFPFVEPGLEVDIACTSCKAQGCRLCKHTGWLEVAGAGMVHPQVLRNANIDPEEYSGYAWGMGIERVAMLLYGVKDIRLFTENNLRFLNQFA